MELNKIYCGDVLEVMRTFPDKSIDCVITSPPYWQLRDYKWDGQWGLEPTYQLYLENLWSMMDEVYRVLKDDGTAWINLGDTYSTTIGGANQLAKGDKTQYGLVDHDNRFAAQQKDGLRSKCLLLIPHRFAIGCMERNSLKGVFSKNTKWIVRNDIIWAKRNGMPESVTDRFSKKHEYFFLMVKQEKYYFDLDGVKDKHKQVSIERAKRAVGVNNKYADFGTKQGLSKPRDVQGGAPEGGKNPGSVSDFWDIPTQPSSDDHYAAYSDLLIGKPIVAGCPKGGIILDPFCGTATTGCRALELGRKFIGIEGSQKYVEIGTKNLSPYIKQQQLF